MTRYGIDIPIEQIKERLTAAFPEAQVFGRIYRNKRGDEIIPEAYIADNEYKDVLRDDSYPAVIFFDVEPERNETNTTATATVNICFLVNLSELYPNTGNSATELAHETAREAIKQTPVAITQLTTGAQAIAQFSLEEWEDMRPFYVFAYKTEIKYSLTTKNCKL